MATKLGRSLLPWQVDLADVAGEVLPSGRMAYPMVVVIAPRRAGKTLLTVANGMQRCSIARDARAWYTAQNGTEAQTTFRDQWVPLVESSPLKPYVKVRKSNGSAGLWLPNGSRFSLFAPTETALHGQDSDLIVIDEAWAFDSIAGAMLEAAVRPTMATRARRQMWIISAGGTMDSTWLLEWRDMCRMLDGPDQGICFVEFYPDGDFDASGQYQFSGDLDDPATWEQVHPAVGHTIPIETLKDDHESMAKQGKLNLFYRSYLDVFTESDDDDLFPPAKVKACQDDVHGLTSGAGLFVGYAVAHDMSSGSVVMARRDGERVTAVLMDKRNGTGWIAGRVAELRTSQHAMPVCYSAGPEGTVTRALADLGIVAYELTPDEWLDGCSELLDDVVNVRLALREQVDVTLAFQGVAKSEVGDRWKISQKRSRQEISPVAALVSSTFKARHAANRRPYITTGQP